MKEKCPKCGGTGGFTLNLKASGWVSKYCDWYGYVYETNLDKVMYGKPPKTAICADCGKRIPNPLLKED